MGRQARLLFAWGPLVSTFAAVFATATSGCGGGWGSGSKWVAQPLDEDGASASSGMTTPIESAESMRGTRPGSRTIGAPPGKRAQTGEVDRTGGGGRPLGTFRNTYYDFPREADHAGAAVSLMSPSCQPIAQVPRSFYDAVCVQGSGTLKRGGTVSFSKRDCACAEVCPRTGQRICFDALDATAFPWGRGAAGTPITPMRTLAADTTILPMGTVVYIPELDGAPRDETGEAHDGCFVVEDRGLRVKGEHVDIFTGFAANTALMNERVPSNQGVTVVVSAPRCRHLVPR
jgi:3D (Asp-Asp-Asp) domain-containing protein